MPERDWNEHYAAGEMPWDRDEADENLVALVEAGTLTTGAALDVGCGTGTHSLWLARRGFDVVGIDIAPLAIDRARAKAQAAADTRSRFEVLDFLVDEPPGGPFQLVFDRGCFHVFDQPEAQARFASRIATLLAPGGQWLSVLGSTEGPPRDDGPPRRTARDIMNAIEPYLEVALLRAIELPLPPSMGPSPKAWLCLSRRRAVPAQPATQA